MTTTALAFQVPPDSAISQPQIDALAEFRRSLRESYELHRLPLQAQLVDQMMALCDRLIRDYPEGCRCSAATTSAKNGNQNLCKCCTRLFKATGLLVELEKLATRRQAHEANLINTFIKSFSEMLKDKKKDDPGDPLVDKIYDMVMPQADAEIPQEVAQG